MSFISSTSTHSWILILLLAVSFVHSQQNIDDNDWLGVNCTTNKDCSKYNGVICATNKLKKQCACKSFDNFHKNSDGSICVFSGNILYSKCSKEKEQPCNVDNSECRDDGMNTGMTRCYCKQHYVTFTNTNGTKECGHIITSQVDSTCKVCEDNEGACYDTNSDNKKDGCSCKISRTGDNCETIHVDVKCDAENKTMTVCYTPHPGVNFTNSNTVMAVSDSKDNPLCKGKPGDNVTCRADQRQLQLSYKRENLNTCNIKKQVINDQESYTAKIAVSKGDGSANIIFKTFCSYKTSANAVFSGISVNGIPGNSRGVHHIPNLKFDLLFYGDSTPVPENVALFIDDQIKYTITLTKDGIYSAINIERCTFSAKPDLEEPCPGCSLLVINNRCPVKSQSRITNNNMLKKDGNNTLVSGMIPVWKFPSQPNMFLHCSVKLCLTGQEKDCEQKDCGGQTKPSVPTPANPAAATTATPTQALPAGRRRRAAVDQTDDSATVTKGLTVYDRNELKDKIIMETWEFGIMLAAVMAIIIILTIACIVLILRMNGRKDKVADMSGPSRNHFALPRINRNNMKI